jgi:flagellar hook-associated protein 2
MKEPEVTITLSGLASNLDTQTILSSLMKIERIPLDQLNQQQSTTSQAKTSLSTFLSKVTAIRTAAASLSDPNGFRSLTATSSDSGVGASVGAGATPGSYSVQVMNLAHEQRTKSNTFASSTDPLGQSGSLTFAVGANGPVTVNVQSGDSLAAIADNINQSGARVSASVLYDGSQYRLMLRGLDTGAANAIAITESGTTLGLASPANTYQSASDSLVKIDGIDVTRSTNVVSGAIPGVTLTLGKQMASAGTINVSSDPNALATKVQALVTAYNDAVSTGHQLAGYGTSKASNTLLQGDSSIRSTLDRLSQVLGSAVAGATGKYTSLSSVGLSSTSDGTLKLDTAKLSAAVAADPTAVARLFTTDSSIGATGAMGTLVSGIDGLTVGTTSLLGSRVGSLDKQAEKLADDALKLQARLDARQTALENQFVQLEMMMSNVNAQDYAYKALTGYAGAFGSNSSTGK